MQFGPFLDGYHDVESQLIDYLRRKAEEAIARRDCEKSNLNSIEDCQRYRQKVREHFLKVIGGLPTSKCELEPQITGVIQGEGYRIEKVIFQSLPGFLSHPTSTFPKVKVLCQAFCLPAAIREMRKPTQSIKRSVWIW